MSCKTGKIRNMNLIMQKIKWFFDNAKLFETIIYLFVYFIFTLYRVDLIIICEP